MGHFRVFEDEFGVVASPRSHQSRSCWLWSVLVASVLAAGFGTWQFARYREDLATKELTDRWLRLLRDGQPEQRDGAVQALASIGPGVADGLVAELGHPDPAVRRAAVQVAGVLLGQCEDNLGIMSCYSPIVFIAGRDEALAAYPVLLRAMVGRLTDGDSEVRGTASQLILKFSQDYEYRLRFPDDGDHRAQAVAALREVLRDAEAGVRRSICERLCSGPRHTIQSDGKDAVPTLADALRDRDAAVRRAPAEALVRSRESAAIVPLIAALKDADPVVRQVADRGTLSLIDHEYDWKPDNLVQIRAAIRGAIPFFIDRMEHFDPTNRTQEQRDEFMQVIRVLGMAGGPEVVPLLVKAITQGTNTRLGTNENDERVMRVAVWALDKVTEDRDALAALKTYVPILTAALDAFDPDRYVHLQSERQAAVVTVLGRVGPDAAVAVPKLISLLNHRAVDRKRVIEALGAIAPSSKEVQDALNRIEAWDYSQAVRDAARKFISPGKP